MNKSKFISELAKQTNYSVELASIINEVLENNFIIGKKNKSAIIEELKEKLNISAPEANKIYEIAINLINTELLNQIRHPLKSKVD